MAKMTDKKPAKAKAKTKAKPSPKAKTKAAAAAARATTQAQAAATILSDVRRPGVERRRNHPTRAKDGHMQILLTNAVPHVGQPGDLVKVRTGFARNYLLPQGLATFATPHNLRIVEKRRARLRALEEAKRADLMNLAAQIAQRSVTIEANANAEGHLYGSVNAEQIAATLRNDNLPLTADNVRIEGPLKELGLYTIKLHLGQEIVTEVKLWVVPTHADEAPAP
jgi:large subunit ribosomal protein L9